MHFMERKGDGLPGSLTAPVAAGYSSIPSKGVTEVSQFLSDIVLETREKQAVELLIPAFAHMNAGIEPNYNNFVLKQPGQICDAPCGKSLALSAFALAIATKVADSSVAVAAED